MAPGGFPGDPYSRILSGIGGLEQFEHGFSYGSLAEKADFLGVPEEAVMKTLYFESGGLLIAAVLPSTEKADLASLSKISGAGKLSLARPESLPYGQAPGSLGPWVLEQDLARVGKIIFHKGPEGDCDWAYPGRPEISLRADYSEVFSALSKAAPEKYGMAEIARACKGSP